MEHDGLKLEFSRTPGCRERHLIRKYNNPFFKNQANQGNQSNLINQLLVEQAREDDLREFDKFTENFDILLKEVSALNGKIDTSLIFVMKERVDNLYDECVSFGHDTTIFKNVLIKLHQTIIDTIRTAAFSDEPVIHQLEREEKAFKIHLQLLEYKLVSDLLRTDSPIADDELVPTMLSEDPESVQVVMSLFEPEQQSAIRDEAHLLISNLNLHADVPERTRLAFEAMSKHKQ